MTDSIPSGYKPLTCDTLPGYLSSRLTLHANREGYLKSGKFQKWGRKPEHGVYR